MPICSNQVLFVPTQTSYIRENWFAPKNRGLDQVTTSDAANDWFTTFCIFTVYDKINESEKTWIFVSQKVSMGGLLAKPFQSLFLWSGPPLEIWRSLIDRNILKLENGLNGFNMNPMTTTSKIRKVLAFWILGKIFENQFGCHFHRFFHK